ncbi:MAG: sugar phosphate nucleotidyltransferase [Polyangiales bacterium]
MLLAAGLGTRLQPLTDLRPKPIVPVANRPLAAFAMDHLARSGVRSIVANSHPQPELVESTLKAASPVNVNIRFSREETLLGTGGGLRKARPLFDDSQKPVIVMNGDTLFAPDLAVAHAQHLSHKAVATMILRRTESPERFGAIGIDRDGWVRSLLGTPDDPQVSEALMFTGVHILSPQAFEAMPESGCVIRSAYRHWVDGGARVLGVVDDSPWADLGTVNEYHRLNLELASGARTWPGIEPRDQCILPASASPSSNVRNSVIGENVQVQEGVTLDRCVVWSDTNVEQSATNAILTPAHRLALD